MLNRINILCAVSFVMMSLAAADAFDDAKNDIIAKQNKVKSLTAKTTDVYKVSEEDVMEITSTEKGSLEYVKKGDVVLYREETVTEGYEVQEGEKGDLAANNLYICDGEKYFVEKKKDGETEVTQMDLESLPLQFIDGALSLGAEGSPLKLMPDSEVDGKKVYVVQTMGEEEDTGKNIMYFDKETGVMLKTEAYDEDGSLFYSRELKEVKVNVKIEDSRFKYTPPADAEVSEDIAVG